MESSDTDLVSSTDSKIVASTTALNKTLSMKKINVATAFDNYFDTTTTKDFCAGLGLSKITTDWDSLVSKASSTTFGGIVAGGSTSTASCIRTPGSQCA